MDRKCDHKDSTYYYPAINEKGWKCVDCKEELGFRPDLDRSLIWKKVDGLLQDLHGHNFLYVSNGSMGEAITHNVVAECQKRDRYDQHTILALLICDPNISSNHAEYWAAQATQKLRELEASR